MDDGIEVEEVNLASNKRVDDETKVEEVNMANDDGVDDINQNDEVQGELSSPMDDNDSAWTCYVTTIDEDDFDEGKVESENELEENPKLEDSDCSYNEMRREPRRRHSDDEFIDLNIGIRLVPHFVNANGKK